MLSPKIARSAEMRITTIVSSDGKIMGDNVNGALARSLGWTTTVLMLLSAVALFATGGL
jgi:hypothetical protein